MTTDILDIARRPQYKRNRVFTHWEGCERVHAECLIQKMAAEIKLHRKKAADIELLRKKVADMRAWTDLTIYKIATVGYILGQHENESLVNAAKRVTNDVSALLAECDELRAMKAKE